jgi:bifunctional UDP-N-acetylglucosamine pyrophosphorylase/glucosamine-1-phosphate N-acetyltransferase/UDP-N-acetylglucosamine pyrophosphorylase
MLAPELIAVVLAAGKGTRMMSDLPKVLVPVLGRPMIEYVLDTLEQAGSVKTIVVVGYRAADVQTTLAARSNLVFVEQREQLGTGHAVQVCAAELKRYPDAAVLVVAGDSPMLRADSVQRVFAEFQSSGAACLLGTAHRENPFGLGRIVRDPAGNFAGIVEEKDASPEQKLITEVNLSCYLFRCGDLLDALSQLGNNNAQREYYLTDVPAILQRAGKKIVALPVLKPSEALSINTPTELAAVEAELLRQRSRKYDPGVGEEV